MYVGVEDVEVPSLVVEEEEVVVGAEVPEGGQAPSMWQRYSAPGTYL